MGNMNAVGTSVAGIEKLRGAVSNSTWPFVVMARRTANVALSK